MLESLHYNVIGILYMLISSVVCLDLLFAQFAGNAIEYTVEAGVLGNAQSFIGFCPLTAVAGALQTFDFRAVNACQNPF